MTLRESCPSCGYEPPERVTIPLRTTATDAVKALDLLQRVGIPAQKELVQPDFVRERVALTAQLLQAELEPRAYERLVPQLQAIWNNAG